MQPNDIFTPDSAAYSPNPENLNGNGANQENTESLNIEYPLESMSYEYMIWADDDENLELEQSCNNSIAEQQSTVTTSSRPNNLISRNNRKNSRNRNLDFSSFDKDGSTTKDLNAHNADILIKYMTLLLRDAEQKQRAIKRLQAEFDKKSKEVANLKDIYEKLKRKR